MPSTSLGVGLSLYCGMTDEEFDYVIGQTDKAMYA